MIDISVLVNRIDDVAGKVGLARSTVSTRVLGSSVRLKEIENGGSITVRLFNRALEKLDEMERAAES